MANATVTTATIFEDSAPVLMARVIGEDAANLVEADISAIDYSVTDRLTRTAVTAATAITVAGTVVDTLQTDARWTVDSTGYNFIHQPAAADFPNKSTYRVEYKLTPTTGEPIWIAFDLEALEIMRT